MGLVSMISLSATFSVLVSVVTASALMSLRKLPKLDPPL
jgi:hypothetical protein